MQFCTTVIVRKPNVRLSDDAEIRTFSCSVHTRSDFGHSVCSNDFERSVFGHHTKLDRFIYKINFFMPIFIVKRSRLVCFWTERHVLGPNDRNPNVYEPNTKMFGFRTLTVCTVQFSHPIFVLFNIWWYNRCKYQEPNFKH